MRERLETDYSRAEAGRGGVSNSGAAAGDGLRRVSAPGMGGVLGGVRDAAFLVFDFGYLIFVKKRFRYQVVCGNSRVLDYLSGGNREGTSEFCSTPISRDHPGGVPLALGDVTVHGVDGS